MTGTRVITKLDEIVENFDYLDEWEDRYRYLIELGRTLEPLDEAAYCDKNKVRGCASQVWLVIKVLRDEAGNHVLYLKGGQRCPYCPRTRGVAAGALFRPDGGSDSRH